MKRYITLLLLIALFPSCETALDMGDDGLGDVLLMNAQMCTSETTHTVWLSLNSPDMISSVSGATVSCYVNDRLVSSTRTVEETDEQSLSPFLKGGFQASGYKIHASFNPGDQICIKADKGDLHCEAHVIVPKAPIILNAQTNESRSRFSVRVQDIKDEYNYYSLSLISQGYVVVEETTPQTGLAPGDTTIRENKVVKIETKGEPLLNSGARTVSNPGSTQESFFDNTNNLFTDQLFRNGEYNIQFTNPKERFDTRPRTWGGGETYMVYNKAVIRILSHSIEEYVYLTGCEYARSVEGNNVLSEQFVFPSNVEGGLGYVSVSASTDYVIEFEPKRYDSGSFWP